LLDAGFGQNKSGKNRDFCIDSRNNQIKFMQRLIPLKGYGVVDIATEDAFIPTTYRSQV
jgi:hypothetical protein